MSKKKSKPITKEGCNIEPYFWAFLDSPAPDGFAIVGLDFDSSDTKPFVAVTVKYVCTKEL
jgi:hypothetical protein